MAQLHRAIVADAAAWASDYGVNRDVTGLACERNILRYRPATVLVRAERGSALADIARVMAAGILAGGPLTLSVADQLPYSMAVAIEAAGIEVSIDDTQTWDGRLAALAASGGLGLRVRVLGPREESAQERWVHACRVSAGSPDIALYTCAVTTARRAAALPARAGGVVDESPFRHAARLGGRAPVALVSLAARSTLCSRGSGGQRGVIRGLFARSWGGSAAILAPPPGVLTFVVPVPNVSPVWVTM